MQVGNFKTYSPTVAEKRWGVPVRIAGRAAAILAPLQLGQKNKLVGYCAGSILLLSAIARELCNCCQRIIRLRKSKMYLSGLCMDSDYHSVPGAFPQPCIRMRACIHGIRSLYTSRPSSTVLDAEIFAQGWKQGAASPECSICSETHATHALHTPQSRYDMPMKAKAHTSPERIAFDNALRRVLQSLKGRPEPDACRRKNCQPG
jgi:hypothetical protein